MKFRKIIRLLVLGLLLGGLFYFKSSTDNGQACSKTIVDALNQGTGEGALDPEWENEQLAKAHALPVLERIDLYLDLLSRGSKKAEAELSIWLATDYQAGSLVGSEELRLVELVLKWPLDSVRRACASILLKEGYLSDLASAETFLSGVSGQVADASVAGADRAVCLDSKTVDNLQAVWMHGVVAGSRGGGAVVGQVGGAEGLVDSGGWGESGDSYWPGKVKGKADGLADSGGRGESGRPMVEMLGGLAQECAGFATPKASTIETGQGVSALAMLSVAAWNGPGSQKILLQFLQEDSVAIGRQVLTEAGQAIIHLARMHPERREELVPALIQLLGRHRGDDFAQSQVRLAISDVLVELSGRDFGDDIEQWQQWWGQMEKRIRKYER